MLQWNVNSVRRRLVELELLLQQYEPTVVILEETKLLCDGDASLINRTLSNYHIHSVPHEPNSGGIIVAVRAPYNSVLCDDLCMAPAADRSSQLVTVDIDGPGGRLRVVGAYRQPKHHTNFWRNIMLPAASRTLDYTGYVVIAGDLNVRHSRWDDALVDGLAADDALGRVLVEWADSNDMCVLTNGQPTHRSGSAIDLFLGNAAATAAATCVNVLPLGGPHSSDHHPVLLEIAPSPMGRDVPLAWRVPASIDWVSYRDVAEHRIRLVLARMDVIERDLAVPARERLDDMVQQLNDVLQQLSAVFLTQPTGVPRGTGKWTTVEFDALVQERKRACRNLADRKDPPQELVNEAADLNALYQSEARRLQSEHEARRLEHMVSQPSIDWKMLKRYADASKSEHRDPLRVCHPQTNASPNDIHEALDNLRLHFSGMMQSAAPSAGDAASEVDEFIATQSTWNERTAECKTVSAADVRNAVRELTVTTASGPDLVAAALLVNGPNALYDALASVFTLSLTTGTVPTAWKRAHITPLFKKGDSRQCSAWRPVAVTSVLARTFERVILARLLPSLLPHISPYQAAFQKGRTMSEQLYALVHAAREALRRNSFRYAAFLDYSRAYDSVWCHGLLLKLHRLGVRGLMLRWIADFLSNRQYRVCFRGSASDWFTSQAGVPQGAVLSCLLFIIYVNDLTVEFGGTGCIPLLAADDVAIVSEALGIGGAPQLQEGLRRIEQWSRRWRMVLNPSKSAVMVLNRPQLRNAPRVTFFIDGVLIAEVSCVKYLGLHVDSMLRWTQQHDMCVSRARRLAALTVHQLTCRLRGHAVPLRVVKTIVLSVFLPTVLHNSEFWLVHDEVAENVIAAQAARILNLAVGLPMRQRLPSSAILAECGIPPITVLAQQRLLSLVSLIMTGPAVTPAAQLLARDCAAPAVPLLQNQQEYLGAIARSVSQQWQLPLPASKVSIRRQKFVVARQYWSTIDEHRLLHTLLPSGYASSEYLLSDYPDARIRAQFRFGVALTRDRRHTIFDPSVSPICPLCGVIDHAVHAVMHCVRRSAARAAFFASLLLRRIDISYHAILGDVSRVPRVHRRWFFGASLAFLRLVYETLYVP